VPNPTNRRAGLPARPVGSSPALGPGGIRTETSGDFAPSADWTHLARQAPLFGLGVFPFKGR